MTPVGLRADEEETAVYVWQHSWLRPVRRAMAEMTDVTDHYMVLSAELALEPQDAVAVHAADIRWDVLAESDRPVTVCVRAATEFLPLMEQPATREAMIDQIVARWLQARERAAANDVDLRGLQIDFDCPTAQLPVYTSFMAALRQRIDGGELSITSLPDWLRTPEMADLVATVDYYVVQVHALDRPVTIDQPVTLFPLERFDKWLTQAEALKRPYYIAMPTYGFRLYYDADGAFTGLTAENDPERDPDAGGTAQTLIADPADVVAAMQTLAAAPSAHRRGVIWFRLPTVADRLNWSQATLRAVMSGRRPTRETTVDLKGQTPGPIDLWIETTGEWQEPNGRMQITFSLTGTVTDLALTPGFTIRHVKDHSLDLQPETAGDTPEQHTLIMTGPAPRLGDRRRAAWFRLSDGATLSIDSHAILPDRPETATTPKAETIPPETEASD